MRKVIILFLFILCACSKEDVIVMDEVVTEITISTSRLAAIDVKSSDTSLAVLNMYGWSCNQYHLEANAQMYKYTLTRKSDSTYVVSPAIRVSSERGFMGYIFTAPYDSVEVRCDESLVGGDVDRYHMLSHLKIGEQSYVGDVLIDYDEYDKEIRVSDVYLAPYFNGYRIASITVKDLEGTIYTPDISKFEYLYNQPYMQVYWPGTYFAGSLYQSEFTDAAQINVYSESSPYTDFRGSYVSMSDKPYAVDSPSMHCYLPNVQGFHLVAKCGDYDLDVSTTYSYYRDLAKLNPYYEKTGRFINEGVNDYVINLSITINSAAVKSTSIEFVPLTEQDVEIDWDVNVI